MKQRAIIMLALLAGVLAGCDRERDVFVPGVPEAYWDYFPYNAGDSLIFSNGTREMAFEVSNVFVEKNDTTIRNVVDYGSSEMSFSTHYNDSFLKIKGTISVPNSLKTASFNLSFYEQSTVDKERSKRCYSFSSSYSYIPQNIVFTDAALKHINEEENCYVIKYASLDKGQGVIAFSDSLNNQVWKLKEIRTYEKR